MSVSAISSAVGESGLLTTPKVIRAKTSFASAMRPGPESDLDVAMWVEPAGGVRRDDRGGVVLLHDQRTAAQRRAEHAAGEDGGVANAEFRAEIGLSGTGLCGRRGDPAQDV